MQDGFTDGYPKSIERSERLKDLYPDLPSRILLELIRSINPERASEIGEILLYPGLEASISRELSFLLESGNHSQREFAVMVTLLSREPEPVAPLDLAYALGVPIATLRGCLRELEKAGAVTHHHSSRHRRRTYVTLTDLGRIQTARGLVIFLTALESIGANLSPTARILLGHLCGTMRANAARHLLRASEAAAASHARNGQPVLDNSRARHSAAVVSRSDVTRAHANQAHMTRGRSAAG